VGFDIVSKAIDNSSIWSPAATTVGLLVAGIILVILTLVAMNMLIILISGWILTYAGVFLLGFGGGRWTQDIALNYYRSILGIALQAFAMILIIGIGKSFIDQYYNLMSKDILLKEMFIMLAVSIVLLVLINKIPPMLAGLVHGGGHFGGGGGPMGGGLGLGGAIGAAGIAGAAAASGIGATAAQTAGGMTALNAAFKAASQSVSMDSDSPSMGSSGSTTKLGGLAAAMGQASNFAASFGSHLASGIADVARDKKDAVKSSISETLSETAGGKVASSISSKSDAKSDASNSSKQDIGMNSNNMDSNGETVSNNVSAATSPSGELSSGSEAVEGSIEVPSELRDAR
jgi:type IV secretion system protein TrbL